MIVSTDFGYQGLAKELSLKDYSISDTIEPNAIHKFPKQGNLWELK
jgi:hypothetical protein